MKVATEGMGGKVIGAVSCDVRVEVGEMKIIQRDFVAVKLQFRVQVLNRFAADHCVGKLDPAASARIRLRALDLDKEIDRAGHGEVVSSESQNLLRISAVYVDTSGNGTRIDELSFLQAGTEV